MKWASLTGSLILATGILGACVSAGTSGPAANPAVAPAAASAAAVPARPDGPDQPGQPDATPTPGTATLASAVVPADPPKALEDLVGSGDLAAALKAVDSSPAAGLDAGSKELVQAHLLLGTGDLPGARQKYQAVLAADSQQAEALFGMAMLARLDGDRQACQAWLDKTIKADPAHAAAYALLGDLDLDRQQFAQAEKNYRKSLSLDNTQYEPLMGMVEVLLEKGRGKAALDYLDRLVLLYPDDAAAWSQRGKVREQEGDADLALLDLDQAVKLEPDSLWHHLDRGRVRFRAGNAAGAREDFDRVVALDPAFFMAWHYLGQVKLSQDELEPAVADFQRALKIRPDYSDVYEALALALFGLSRHAEAAGYFEKAYNPREKNERTLLMAAVCLFQLKDAKGLKEAGNRFALLMDREGMFYNLLRFLLEPSIEGLVLSQIDKTKDAQVKAVYGFYATFPLQRLGRTQAAIRLLEDARDRAPQGTLESRIARWSLKQYE